MYRILEKKVLNPTVIQRLIEAPLVANKAKPATLNRATGVVLTVLGAVIMIVKFISK